MKDQSLIICSDVSNDLIVITALFLQPFTGETATLSTSLTTLKLNSFSLTRAAKDT